MDLIPIADEELHSNGTPILPSSEPRILSSSEPPAPLRCGFFVKRKQRCCRMQPSRGQPYCPEHMSEDQTAFVGGCCQKRVPCPIDPTHTVFEQRLNKHLKKCNSLKKINLPYYEKDVNAGLKDYTFSSSELEPLSSCPSEELKSLIARVRDCERLITTETVTERLTLHPVLDNELGDSERTSSTNVRKHLLQNASLIQILHNDGLLATNTVFLEMGAGRGKLSHWTQRAMKDSTGCGFLLVDRSNNRNKLDCYHRGEEQGPVFERLYIDIQHLQLEKVDSLINDVRGIVAIGKHLCGAATDLSINCLIKKDEGMTGGIEEVDFDQTEQPPIKKMRNATHLSLDDKDLKSLTTPTETDDKTAQGAENVEMKPSCHRKTLSSLKLRPVSSRLSGCLFALCCYHRCSWPSYVGREFFIEQGFTPLDFYRITKMAGWSVCAFHKGRENGDMIQETKIQPTRGASPPTTNNEVDDGANQKPTDDDEIGHEPADNGERRETFQQMKRCLGLSSDEQEHVGRLCKRVIDLGRMDFLRKRGFSVELVKYVEAGVTLENIALLVKKNHVTV